MKRRWKGTMRLAVVLAFALAAYPSAVVAGDAVGKLQGFVYREDGKKTLAEAVVLIRESITQRVFQSGRSKKNGVYVIGNILPGLYNIGIQFNGREYNVDALLKIEPKKQMACFTLPEVEAKPGYLIRCRSPKCFFITPWGWALIAGVTAGVTYGVVRITEREVSPTGI